MTLKDIDFSWYTHDAHMYNRNHGGLEKNT